MQFNENKFELLRFGKHQDIKRLHLILWTKQQNKSKCVKDLGIKTSDNLSFTDHIETACNKVWQKCGGDHKNCPCQRYAQYENSMVQHSHT